MTIRAHFIVHGRVQGVCYRMCASDEASRLGLTGWARNQRDGSVEIVAEGDDKALNDFLAWCRHGPPHARVTEVDADYSAATGEFGEFTITY